MDPVAEELHAAPDHLVWERAHLHGEVEHAVAELAMYALDLLDHGLGTAAEHGAPLDRLVERQRAALVETALPAVAALLVLEIARLLQHDPLRSLQPAHQDLVEVLQAVRQMAPRLLVGFGDAGVHADEHVFSRRFPSAGLCRLLVDA